MLFITALLYKFLIQLYLNSRFSPSMISLGQRKINFATKVMDVFTEVQKNVSIHKTHIFQLIKFSQDDY